MEEIFSVKDVSRLFGLSESRLRYWAQTGFIGPSIRRGARRFYSFSDLIGIKVARELLSSGLSLQRVRKNLHSLRTLLPDVEQPLSRLRVLSDGEHMWVQSGEATFDAASGQLMFSLDTGDLQDEVVRVLDLARPPQPRAAPRPPKKKAAKRPRAHRDAYRWFLEGLAHDESTERMDEAMDAYRRALELDPSLAAAHTNLGIACYRRGKTDEARQHFERALSLDPDLPEAGYNLANLHEETGELDLAIAEYRRVALTSPTFADAHFNLAIALEKVGSRIQAAEHFERYLVLCQDDGPGAVWCRLAKAHLAYLTGDPEPSLTTPPTQDPETSGDRREAQGTSEARTAPPTPPEDLPEDPPF